MYGHVTVDQIISIDQFLPPGITADALSKKTTLGGTGPNIAVSAAKLGCPTALCAFVGPDFPAKYMEFMESSGLMMDEVVTLDEEETSTCVIINDRDLVTRVFFYQGPQGHAVETGVRLNRMAKASANVHFCTGQPAYYISLMEELKGGRRISLDPAQEVHRVWNADLVSQALPMADALFCNDLEAGRYGLHGFSLIIYDEAHRGTGNYAYVRVAGFCPKGARCVGMTASPGSSVSRIEEVCINLHLRRIDVKSDDDPDVSPYIHYTYVNRIELNVPQDLMDASALLRSILDHFVGEMASLGLVNPSWQISTTYMLTIGANLQARLSRGEKTAIVFRGLALHSICIKLLHAVALAETQGMTPLRTYLRKIEEEADQKEGGRSAREIVKRPEFVGVRSIMDKSNVEHSKVSRVMSIVSRTVNSDPDAKVMVFAQYRETCEMLVSKISAVEGARVALLVGQSNGGLKQKEQVALLDGFRGGEYNVIVSTSVGEEGLDVSSTNAVIFYEPVSSEIRTIQRRGRTGRKNDGEVYVLVAKGTLDEVLERSSAEKEAAMRARLEKLSQDLSRGTSPIVRKNQMKLDGFR